MPRRRSNRSGYTDMVMPEERIHRLQASVQQLLTEVERLPADVLYREPRAGEWPVMSTLAHVAEILPYWAHQAEHVVRNPGAPFGRALEDPGRIAAIDQHSRDSQEAIVARTRGGLNESGSTLRSMPADAWSTVGQHPRRGSMTVDQLVQAFLLDHVDEHAAQVAAAVTALAPTGR